MTECRMTLNAALLSLLCLAVSCTGEPDMHLRTAPPPGSDTLRNLRQRQLLRVRNADGTLSEFPILTEDPVLGVLLPTASGPLDTYRNGECTARLFEAANPGHTWKANPFDCGFDPDGQNGCDVARCLLDELLCKLHLNLELASLTASVKLRFAAGGSVQAVEVPPQGRASAAALRELALAETSTFPKNETLTTVLSQLSEANDCAATVPEADPPFTRADEVVAVYAEMYHLANEAAQTAAADYVAVADSERNAHASASDGAKAARDLRAHAASMFVGGGIMETVTTSFPLCTVSPLSPGGRAALEVLRQSGLPPATVIETPITQLIDLLAPRLFEVWGRGLLLSASYEADPAARQPVDAVTFLARLGLSAPAFVEARQAFAEEQQAFLRSPDMLAEPPTSATDAVGDYHAATANPPTPPSWALYSNLLRDPNGLSPSQLAMLDEEQASVSRAMLSLLDVSLSIAALGARGGPFKALTRLEETVGLDFEGLAFTTTRKPAEEFPFFRREIVLSVDVPNADNLVLVTNPQSLACATLGSAEGISCNWQRDVSEAGGATVMSSSEFETEFTDLAPNILELATQKGLFRFVLPTLEAPEPEKFVVLRLKANQTPRTPGAYEPLVTGFTQHVSAFRQYAIASSLEQQAGELLRPRTDWCAQPEENCAFAVGRLPLEDELTDNGDEFENSWRRYVDLARQAANEADLLGEETIRQGLDVALRAEQAIEELEQLCGVPVDLDPLSSEIDSDTRTSPTDAVSSTATQSTSSAKLAQCLGSSGLVRYVGIGSSPLCTWHVQGDPSRFCEGANDTVLGCPRLATREESNTGDCDSPEGTTPVLISDRGPDNSTGLLHLVDPPEAAPPVPEPAVRELCVAVRRLREAAAHGDEDTLEDAWRTVFVDSGVYEPSHLREDISGRVHWEAATGSHSALLVDDFPVISTGNIYEPGSCTTLLSDEDLADCAEHPSSLFCAARTAPCNTQEERAPMNARLARAAMVARWLGGRSLEEFLAPDTDQSFPSGKHRSNIDFRHDVDGEVFGLFTESNVGDAEGSARYYCYDNEFSARPMWIWAPADPSLPFDFGATNCLSEDTVRFTRLSGNKVFGKHRVGVDIVEAHITRAFRLMDALRRHAEGSLPAQLESLAPSGMQGISTTCASCGLGNSRPFPWVDAVDNNTIEKVRNMRYFLDLRDDDDLPEQAFFDGLELLCETDRFTPKFTVDVPALTSSTQLTVMEQVLHNAADQFRRIGNSIVFQDLPESVYAALHEEAPLGGTGTLNGDYGASILRLRAAMESLGTIPGQVSDELDGLARDLRRTRIALQENGLEEDLLDIGVQREFFQRLTDCAVSVANAAGQSTPSGKIAGAAAAAATCYNSYIQIGLAFQEVGIRRRLQELGREDILVRFQEQAAVRASTLEQEESRLRSTANEIAASLEDLAGLRNRAQRALGKALFLDQDEAGHVYQANTIMRRRLATAQQRYQRARRDAIRMAYLAKLAIEQRLGVELASMDDDMTLVDAPASWEATLCTLDGIDFNRIRDASDSTFESFSDGYIGDYVRKLERFVDSYRIDFPFQNGQDTAVISLRDDVQRVRDVCDRDIPNLLYHTRDITESASSGEPTWTPVGCRTSTTTGDPLPNCVTTDPLGEEGPALPGQTLLGVPAAMRVTFGPPHPLCVDPTNPDCPCDGNPECGFQPGAGLGQPLALAAGPHRLSWFARPVGAASGSDEDAAHAVVVRGTTSGMVTSFSGDSTECTEASEETCREAENGWRRYWFLFDMPAPEDAVVTIVSATDQADTSVDIAGLMLEDLNAANFTIDPLRSPPEFLSTGETLTHPLPLCEDTDGSVFRAKGWRTNCVPLCTNGFGGGCATGTADVLCYQETEFSITQEAIDRGAIFTNSGFARGNFNYRVDSIGLNFVGTAARRCTDPELTSTCFNAGFIPYTLEHQGPFLVRNDFGDNYYAPIFTGFIEHARGLAAERYLSNPLSSADQALIDPYVQRQFRGRPLTGTYRLRVWEEPGVNFEGIEDVQVILNYRFWTRFE